MKLVKSLLFVFRDLLLQLYPFQHSFGNYSYVFLVHPRSEDDVLKKYPFLKYLPSKIILCLMRYHWPITVTKVTGLKLTTTGESINGLIIAIPLTAKQIIENRSEAVRSIRRAVHLGKRLGAKLFGLGGLISSVTRGGLELLDIPNIAITTGHAYTGYNVTQNVLHLCSLFKSDKKKSTIAIVGAAGSIGSISAQILVREGFRKILLIDLERKRKLIDELLPQLHSLATDLEVTISHQVGDVIFGDYIIAATNAPEALIHAEDLKRGAVIVDDAQPSDVADDVFDRSDVLAIEAGVVHTPGIRSHFDMGLKGQNDNFCCMAELIILAANGRSTNYVINRATLAHVDEIAEWGTKLDFGIARLQNRKRLISEDELKNIATIKSR